MERRDSTIQLSTDLVDQNGLARFTLDEDDWAMPMKEDSEIAPWIEQDVPVGFHKILHCIVQLNSIL